MSGKNDRRYSRASRAASPNSAPSSASPKPDVHALLEKAASTGLTREEEMKLKDVGERIQKTLTTPHKSLDKPKYPASLTERGVTPENINSEIPGLKHRRHLHQAIMEQNDGLVCDLMYYGADADKPGVTGETARELAEAIGNQFILDHIDHFQPAYTTPGKKASARAPKTKSDHLFAAVRADDLAAVRKHTTKSTVNARDADGATPLMHASAGANPAIIAHLLANGADDKAVDATGRNAKAYMVNRLKKN